MSEDKKPRKDEKRESDGYSSDSSTSSCTSQATNKTNLDSESIPADLLTFDFPVDSPPVRREPFQVEQSEVQSALAEASTSHGKRRRTASSPSDDIPLHLPCLLKSRNEEESRCSAAMGALQKQLKTFTKTKDDEKCLVESDSSEQISETVAPQPEIKPVPVDEGENKKRSSSLPIHIVPVDITSQTSQKRTKSEGAIQSPLKTKKSASPKKASPLKRAATRLLKVVTRSNPHQDKHTEKQSEISAVSDSIPEVEESGNEKERADDSGAGRAEAATIRAETIHEESEPPSDHEEATPRRSRRLSNLRDKSSGSPAKGKK